MTTDALKPSGANRRLLQLEQCLAGCNRSPRPPARVRLETLLGEDLTRRLVFALTRTRAG